MLRLVRPSDSLAAKLIIAIGLIMAAGSLIAGFLYYNYERDVTLRNLANHARVMTNLVQGGLRHSMLTARPAVIQLTFETFGQSQDVRMLVLYDRDGRARHSSQHSMLSTTIPEGSAEASAALKGEMPEPVVSRDSASGTSIEIYRPLLNEPSCSTTAECHVHPVDTDVLGVLRASYSARSIEDASRDILMRTFLLWAFVIALLCLSLFAIHYKLVTKPLALMEQGVKKLAKGEFDQPIEIATTDEMGRLARNFNIMAYDIQRYKTRLENWAKELQAEVDKKTAEIRSAQDQLLNAEKLASLGRLSAGVAHELNNPLTGIVTFAHLMKERTPEDRKEDHEDLDMIIEQADRCTKIVKGLLGFSRKGTSEKMRSNINDIVEKAIGMMRNQAAFHDIQIKLELAPKMPEIQVDTNQILQVILNLFTNAADAMNGVGLITITTSSVLTEGQRNVEMTFTDTGPGIMPEHMDKILEPFFTTKEVGKGTGLGLPVSYGIIKRHGGDILVRSKVGRGATFIVRLPVAEAEGTADQAKGGSDLDSGKRASGFTNEP